ncbi:MAG: hypothetical protein KJ886_06425 [Candidatus Thermoplasmatota archaeon]|nr:hypothetical protein [Candidatus Thermoplasmatota archaeon]
MVRISEFDFAHPTGIIGLILVVLSLVAVVVSGVLSVQGNAAAAEGYWYAARDWYAAAMYTSIGAFLGFIIGVVFLFISRKIKMERTQQPPPPQQRP